MKQINILLAQVYTLTVILNFQISQGSVATLLRLTARTTRESQYQKKITFTHVGLVLLLISYYVLFPYLRLCPRNMLIDQKRMPESCVDLANDTTNNISIFIIIVDRD